MSDFLTELKRLKRDEARRKIKRVIAFVILLFGIGVTGIVVYKYKWPSISSIDFSNRNNESNKPPALKTSLSVVGTSVSIDSLMRIAINAVRKENFTAAIFVIQQAQKSSSSYPLVQNKKAMELYLTCQKAGNSSFEALVENGDYALIDIPLNYYKVAQSINPSDELAARIDDCRSKYQQATAK